MSYLARRTAALSFEPFRLSLELPPDLIKLTVGEPDFDTPAPIREAAKRAIDGGQTHYTAASGRRELRDAVALKLQRDNGAKYGGNDVVVTSGSSIAVHLSLLALLNPGDHVLLPDPAWFHYDGLIRLCEAEVVRVPLRPPGFSLRAADVETHLTDRTKLIIINSPNNPTGSVQEEGDLRRICQLAHDRGVFILSDENYEKIVYPGARHVSSASLAPDITILTGGFSKGYAMTGWRIGYVAAPPTIAERVATLHAFMALGPSSIAQAAALEALTNPAVEESVQAMVTEFAARRDIVVDEIASMEGLSCGKPQGAFYAWVNIHQHGLRAVDFVRKLATEAKLGLSPGSIFGNAGEIYVRLSFAARRDMLLEGLRRLRAFVHN
jgi:aspartate/methionine/tyrosine aminotransferase